MALIEIGNREVKLRETANRARDFLKASRADNTHRAYRTDWQHFVDWCDSKGLASLPAEPATVAYYVTDLAETHKPTTIGRRLVAISGAHKAAAEEPPTKDERVRLVYSGIRRTVGTAQDQVRPLVTDDLRKLAETCGSNLMGRRDRALLLIGFAAALRRSELVALDAGDVEETKDGLVLRLRRSKTDQEASGRRVGVPYGSHPVTCPVRAWKAWLEASQIRSGPAFRPINRWGQLQEGRLSDRAVALVIKRRAELAGIDPDEVSGHSLRAGLATAAAQAGVSERAIMAQTGHRSLPMVRRYIREGSLFNDNAASAVGL